MITFGAVIECLCILDTLRLTSAKNASALAGIDRKRRSLSYTGHLRYVKLGCLENPTYVEVISHSRVSLLICFCISTLLVSNSVMMKTRLCRSDNLFPTENTVSFNLPVSNFEVKNYLSGFMISTEDEITRKKPVVYADLISSRNLSSMELLRKRQRLFRRKCMFESTIDGVNMVKTKGEPLSPGM